MRLNDYVVKKYGKEIGKCSNEELYYALLQLTQDMAEERISDKGKKKLYYISAEFLIGKLLSNNLINLGVYEDVKAELDAHGKSLAEIEEVEPEPSLGNGGLGRLAACFLDSIATLGLNGDGIGLNYHLGLFKQEFVDRLQKETANPWIPQDTGAGDTCGSIPEKADTGAGDTCGSIAEKADEGASKAPGSVLEERSWLRKRDVSYQVKLGNLTVKSSLYDIAVTGYGSRTNQLHLFDLDSVDESIVTDGISFDKEDIEKNLTLFLYPDDSDDKGRLLRIYQQYFMVSNGAQLILDECVAKGCNLHDLADYAVIQINDTHPTLVIPELIRLLMERGIDVDEAARIVSRTCAYTNHTILAEALEKWPMHYLKKVVPHLVPIIEILDDKVRRQFDDTSLAIIDKNDNVHMAHIDIHYGFSVNGVAYLHTEILKNNELNKFYKIYPEKFNNKTNGITFRRWLLHCNHQLSDWISSRIGDGYKQDASELEKLAVLVDDKTALREIQAIKHLKKKELKEYLLRTQGIEIDDHSILDIQIKRLHEYKRQQMNALFIIHKYLEIKGGKRPNRPITIVFGAKAAPAYVIAKDIIHLILCLQELVNNDPEVSPYLKVVMVENYNVTLAEKLIPACDISEQISLASKEASGTGNMKFMLNGAVTLGTMDGANVEIAQLVGRDNIYIFGENSETVIKHYEKGDYKSRTYYEKNKDIKAAVDFIVGPELLKIGHKENLERLYKELLNKDWFMTLLDFEDYVRVKEQAYKDFEDRESWMKKMLINISKAGFFSSDRTIDQYNRDIWKLES